MSLCTCRHCFPTLGKCYSKTPWCREKTTDSSQQCVFDKHILNDLPDDILVLIRRKLKQIVKTEKPYDIPASGDMPHIMFADMREGEQQWLRQKTAIALTSKAGIRSWDQRKCVTCLERCSDCFRMMDYHMYRVCKHCQEEEDVQTQHYFIEVNMANLL